MRNIFVFAIATFLSIGAQAQLTLQERSGYLSNFPYADSTSRFEFDGRSFGISVASGKSGVVELRSYTIPSSTEARLDGALMHPCEVMVAQMFCRVIYIDGTKSSASVSLSYQSSSDNLTDVAYRVYYDDLTMVNGVPSLDAIRMAAQLDFQRSKYNHLYRLIGALANGDELTKNIILALRLLTYC